MTPYDVLTAARELLSKGWTQGAYARSATGIVDCYSTEAISFCLWGAVRRVAGDNHASRSAALAAVAAQLPEPYLSGVNGKPQLVAWHDQGDRTQADILALIDHAIASFP